MFKSRILSDQELDEQYGGEPREEIGSYFKTNDNHYYMQRENDVLHIFDKLINCLHNSIFDEKYKMKFSLDYDKTQFIPITEDEFLKKLRLTVFDIGILNF